MKTIRISDEVWQEIAKRGKFGETEDDVLRRIFDLNVVALHKPKKRRKTTNTMTVKIEDNELLVKFADGNLNTWILPLNREDREALIIRREAIEFAKQNGATRGQICAVIKTLTQAGYYKNPRKR